MYCRNSSLLLPEESLVLAVDLQERLIPAIAKSNAVVLRCRQIFEAAKTLSIPIAVSEQYPQGLGHTLPMFQEILGEGTPVFAKKSFSVCGDESIRYFLEHHPARQVVIFGVETHVCVLQSAYDLQALGKDVFVAVDACGCRFAKDYRIALRRMSRSGITLTTAESVIFEWCATAQNPHFKTISRIAKDSAE